MTNEFNGRGFVSVTEAARFLGISRGLAYKLAHQYLATGHGLVCERGRGAGRVERRHEAVLATTFGRTLCRTGFLTAEATELGAQIDALIEDYAGRRPTRGGDTFGLVTLHRLETLPLAEADRPREAAAQPRRRR